MPKPRIKGYEILDVVGNGAGSVVYKAIETATRRVCAVKHVTRSTIESIEKARRDMRTGDRRLGPHARLNYDGFFEQIRNEYRVLRTLDKSTYSPHIVRVDNLLTIRHLFRVYGYDLIMEFIDGLSLSDKRDHPIPDLIRFYREAALALAYLHAHRILHTDLKPQHIFITRDGHAKILDFGLARFFGDPPGGVQGTVDFMAPEQAKGKEMTPRTDVYGLGATLYWVLTGQPNRPSIHGVSGGVGFTVGFAGRADSVRDQRPDCPPALDELIIQSCERRPSKRPASMNDVIARLDAMRF
jgi:serine/threonine protein kinase